MKKLKIKFNNCYGINKIETEFDFSQKRVIAVYAPNGIMKSSFARTFRDLSNDVPSKDRVYKDKETTRSVEYEDGTPILPSEVYVIDSYDEEDRSAKISTLLVNKTLKKEYDENNIKINDAKTSLLKVLKKDSGLTGTKENIDEILSLDVAHERDKFFVVLGMLDKLVAAKASNGLEDIVYKKIFNDKTNGILQSSDFIEKVDEYINVYDELLEQSTFFKKGSFNHDNASDVAKNLKNNGFFKVGNSVLLNGKETTIKTEEELVKIIEEEKSVIVNDPQLLKSFESINDKLNTKDLKEFREYLSEHNKIIPELKNLPAFKRNLWVAYLSKNEILYRELLDEYEKGFKRNQEIEQIAKQETPTWKKVIDTFNRRFFVPFEVKMNNCPDVMLKNEIPRVEFRFNGGDTAVPIETTELRTILSQGEKRALYILNIIFEVEARKANQQKTLFVIDDIADSFDYKNKYAIIEYLNDMSKEEYFYQIVLTHNFDFFRTITGRLNLERHTNVKQAVKVGDSIIVKEEKYQKDLFKHWKTNLHTNNEMLIAAIPFARNLAQYCGLTDNFNFLTALLHKQPATSSITVLQLEQELKQILKDEEIKNISLPNPNKLVEELIYDEATLLEENNNEDLELESKIVLSIAIRLKTESFLITKINDPAFVSRITENQTIALIKKYKKMFPSDTENIELIEKVNLMTPENIHLNSFMYEPILDMSNEHLKGLYREVKNLVV